MKYRLENRYCPNMTPGRPYGSPRHITIHHWGADGQTHDGVANYLARAGIGKSANYVASAGRVTQLVHPDNTAWANGNWKSNCLTISIECRPEMSSADFATVAELIRDIRSRYGNLPLIGHKDVVATACPGRWYPKLKELDSLARHQVAKANPSNKPKNTRVTTEMVKKAQHIAGVGTEGYIVDQDSKTMSKNYPAWNKVAYRTGDGKRGSDLVKKIQTKLGVYVDGILGPVTCKAWQKKLEVATDGIFGPYTADAWKKTLDKGKLF